MVQLLTPQEIEETGTWSEAPALGVIAGAIGDPSRLRMLATLMDGRAYTATTLALEAGIAPSTASAHLSQLVEAGLVRRAPSPPGQGRYHYYEVAGHQVAEACEALKAIAPANPAASLIPGSHAHGMRAARICYDHLAGRAGVSLMDALVARRLLEPHDAGFALTAEGQFTFGRFGIDVAALRCAKRPLIRTCTDWSEQRPHLSGALGAALLAQSERRGWIERIPADRMLTVTPGGAQGLRQWFGLELVA